jgi:TPR repeat protein
LLGFARALKIRMPDAKIGITMKHVCAVAIACGAGFLLLSPLDAFAPRLRAQSAELVLCDRVAAEPTDPDKPAEIKGVASIAPADVAIALKYCKAASAKSRRAMYALGRAYAANRQMADAIAAYRKAADKGSSAAMVELGVLYATGAGVAKDDAQARQLLERAAKAGNPRAATSLAAFSANNAGSLNPGEARSLLEKAAAANSADAEFQLGLMSAQGQGGPQDDVAARALFERAAAQGHAEAMVWAGAFAQLGRGGPENKDAAKEYFRKAAALGNEEAKQRLKQIECPYVLKDKRGNVMTNLCF